MPLDVYYEFSDEERALREARRADRQGWCSLCHLPRSVCTDPAAKFYPQREVHYASMEREAANARWARLHDERAWHDGTFRNWAAKPSDSHPYHRDHGVVIGVHQTDLRPDDKFLTHEKWGPDQVPEPDDAGASS